MPDERRVRCLGASVEVGSAERLLKALKSAALLEASLKPLRGGGRIVFPVKAAVPESILEMTGAVLVEEEFVERRRCLRSIREALSGELAQDLIAKLPSSYDIIGDIAVVHIPQGLEPYASLIGEAIIRVNQSVKSVWGEAGAVEGVFRTRRLVHLAGDDRTSTIHKENGCLFQVDLRKVYFTPRLAGERMRLAAQTRREETVADMFAGVGPFSITIARHAGARVYAAEINPDAYSLLVENIRLNKVSDRVIPLFGDCRTVFSGGRVVADRIIMNYPSDPLGFLDAALKILPGRGTIHLYGFTESLNKLRTELQGSLKNGGVSGEVSVKKLRAVSPRRFLAAADIVIESR